MSGASDTIRVVIPLTIRKRNGRPRILPPDDLDLRENRAQEPHVLRAVARAWNWRRQLETGAASTIQDIGTAEKVSDRYVSRMLRLAYLSPEVLEHLLIRRVPPAVSLNDLGAAASGPERRRWGRCFLANSTLSIHASEACLKAGGCEHDMCVQRWVQFERARLA
jgi:hypothetical protein